MSPPPARPDAAAGFAGIGRARVHHGSMNIASPRPSHHAPGSMIVVGAASHPAARDERTSSLGIRTAAGVHRRRCSSGGLFGNVPHAVRARGYIRAVSVAGGVKHTHGSVRLSARVEGRRLGNENLQQSATELQRRRGQRGGGESHLRSYWSDMCLSALSPDGVRVDAFSAQERVRFQPGHLTRADCSGQDCCVRLKEERWPT